MSTHVLTSILGRNSGPPSATLVRKPITLPPPLLNSWAVDLSSQIVSLDDVSTCIQLFAAIFWPPFFVTYPWDTSLRMLVRWRCFVGTLQLVALE